MNIVYRAGTERQAADALSCLTIIEEEQFLKENITSVGVLEAELENNLKKCLVTDVIFHLDIASVQVQAEVVADRYSRRGGAAATLQMFFHYWAIEAFCKNVSKNVVQANAANTSIKNRQIVRMAFIDESVNVAASRNLWSSLLFL